MKQTAWTVVRDDGVAGSNPATPRPDRTTSRITTTEKRLAMQTRRLRKLTDWAQKLVDRDHRIDNRVLLHRLKQCIDAADAP
jgi:hypothetical protein